jgi:hypothetical protein
MITNLNFVFTQTELTNLIHQHIRDMLKRDLELITEGVEVSLVKVGAEIRASAIVTIGKTDIFFK